MNWLISVPAWGERYRKAFVEHGLPSLCAALEYAKLENVRFLVHTDEPCFVMLPNVEFLPPPTDPGSRALGECARRALAHAHLGENICFFNADYVVSREAFQIAEQHFGSGKRLIQCHAIRTVDRAPPAGSASRRLVEWGLFYRHPWFVDCMYGYGRAAQPAIVVFEEDKNIVVHAFSLASFACRKDRWSMKFDVPTMDDLPTYFGQHEIYIVTDPDEMAIVEPCGDIEYPRFKRRVLDERVIRKFGPYYATPAMYRQFGQQIVLRGDRLPWAKEIADECLRKLDTRHNPVRFVAPEKPGWVIGA